MDPLAQAFAYYDFPYPDEEAAPGLELEQRKDLGRIEYTGGEIGWIGDVPRFQYDLGKIHALGWAAKHPSDEAVRRAVRAEIDLTGEEGP